MGGAWFWEEGGAASGREGCNEMRFHSSVSTVYVNHIFAVLPLFINQFANYHPGPILLIAPYAPKVPHDKDLGGWFSMGGAYWGEDKDAYPKMAADVLARSGLGEVGVNIILGCPPRFRSAFCHEVVEEKTGPNSRTY